MTRGNFSLQTRDQTDIIPKKNFSKRCSVPAKLDVTYPYQLRIHNTKYLGLLYVTSDIFFGSNHFPPQDNLVMMTSVNKRVTSTRMICWKHPMISNNFFLCNGLQHSSANKGHTRHSIWFSFSWQRSVADDGTKKLYRSSSDVSNISYKCMLPFIN